MDYFETYENLPDEARGCVIVIGNFDGVHIGHQALLKRANEVAHKMNEKVGVLTFEPHPRQLFRSDETFSRITPCELKKERLRKGGADIVFSLPFDWDFASQPPENFVQQILIDGLEASHVVIGHDFRFGQLRSGGAETIEKAGIPISAIGEVTGKGGVGELSSSHARQHLRDGQMQEAAEVLGWTWELRGEIIYGDQRGRELGYPTANMEFGDALHPAYGVYACRARLVGEKEWHPGVANIGIRPMFAVEAALIETYIFNFDRDIYGRTLRVQPIKRLRGEAKFESLDLLVQQIRLDCIEAQEALDEFKVIRA